MAPVATSIFSLLLGGRRLGDVTAPIFWSDRVLALGRFPPPDRVDYLDHAVALVESERLSPPRPTLEEIRKYLRGAIFATWVDRARNFAAAEKLEPKNHKMYLRTIL